MCGKASRALVIVRTGDILRVKPPIVWGTFGYWMEVVSYNLVEGRQAEENCILGKNVLGKTA